MTEANGIFEHSGVALELRIVGMVEVWIDEEDEWSGVGRETLTAEVDRHGADLAVLFRPHAPNPGTCGYAADGEVDGRIRLANVVGARH